MDNDITSLMEPRSEPGGAPERSRLELEVIELQRDLIKANDMILGLQTLRNVDVEKFNALVRRLDIVEGLDQARARQGQWHAQRILQLEAAVQELNPALNLVSPIGRGEPPATADMLKDATQTLRVVAPATDDKSPQAEWVRPERKAVDTMTLSETETLLTLSFVPAGGESQQISFHRIGGVIDRKVASVRLRWFSAKLSSPPAWNGSHASLEARISELERQNADLQAANNTLLERTRFAEETVSALERSSGAPPARAKAYPLDTLFW